ncbi:DUF4124 domain-containing protein [Chitinibacter sp. S2-10]|uniref:DUF4124 domain-containing protein n=1 Tax=Chitinibacter sp. S2-10 TaxID=3373597 RepID=UPI003977AE93
MKSLVLLLLMCSVNLYAGQVYKCKDKAGKTLYQDTPCTTGTQQILTNLPSNSIKGPAIAPKASASFETAPASPARTDVAISPAPYKVDPNLPATENCSMDNPNRDPEFCRPSNLDNVYGDPNRDRRPNLLPRPQPLPVRPKR